MNLRGVLVVGSLVGCTAIVGCGARVVEAADGAALDGAVEKREPVCSPFDYSAYTPTSASLTLTRDIAPILQTSCALALSCHGTNEPHMGAAEMTLDPVAARGAVVGVASLEVPGLFYVKAGDPESSWLMKKLEGVQSCSGFTCVAQPGNDNPASPCGDRMPQPPSDPLTSDRVQKIRDWIKSGALL